LSDLGLKDFHVLLLKRCNKVLAELKISIASDIILTKNLVKACKFIDLPVTYNMIIAGKSFTSLSDSGLI